MIVSLLFWKQTYADCWRHSLSTNQGIDVVSSPWNVPQRYCTPPQFPSRVTTGQCQGRKQGQGSDSISITMNSVKTPYKRWHYHLHSQWTLQTSSDTFSMLYCMVSNQTSWNGKRIWHKASTLSCLWLGLITGSGHRLHCDGPFSLCLSCLISTRPSISSCWLRSFTSTRERRCCSMARTAYGNRCGER